MFNLSRNVPDDTEITIELVGKLAGRELARLGFRTVGDLRKVAWPELEWRCRQAGLYRVRKVYRELTGNSVRILTDDLEDRFADRPDLWVSDARQGKHYPYQSAFVATTISGPADSLWLMLPWKQARQFLVPAADPKNPRFDRWPRGSLEEFQVRLMERAIGIVRGEIDQAELIENAYDQIARSMGVSGRFLGGRREAVG